MTTETRDNFKQHELYPAVRLIELALDVLGKNEQLSTLSRDAILESLFAARQRLFEAMPLAEVETKMALADSAAYPKLERRGDA